MSDTHANSGNEGGSILTDLHMIKSQLIDIDMQINALIIRKKNLVEMVTVAQELTFEILALGVPKLDIPIDQLHFSNGTRTAILNALRALNIKTLGDISHESEESLSKTPTLAKAIDDIKSVLAKHGLSFK